MRFVASALTHLITASLLTDGGVSAVNASATSDKTNLRRHLLDDKSECVTYLKITAFVDAHHEEVWCCEFSPKDADKFGGHRMLEIDGIDKEELEAKGVVSGATIIRFDQSSSSTPSYTEHYAANPQHHALLWIPQGSDFTVERMDAALDFRHTLNRRAERHGGRRLTPTTGAFETLVVRVLDGSGVGPSADAAQLEDDIFLDDYCLASHYKACSYDLLTIFQSTQHSSTSNGKTINGIVDIKSDIVAVEGNHKTMEADVREKVADTFGVVGKPLAGSYDLVVYCMPPGTGDQWVAYAYLNQFESFYNDPWCQYFSGMMHEVGHNLNLAHSNFEGEEYGDTQGMMGFSFRFDDTPIQCFNAAKSMQLGWYPEQSASIKLGDMVGAPQSFVLNGVADYKPDGSNGDKLVTLRLEYQGFNDGKDYYVGYNRAVGINKETSSVPDTVALMEKLNDEGSIYGLDYNGKSNRLAALVAGESFKVDLAEYSFTLTVNSIEGADASVEILVEQTAPTAAPVQAPECDGAGLQVDLLTDTYGTETSWGIFDLDSNAMIIQGKDNFGYGRNTRYILPSPEESFCLGYDRCFIFFIGDAGGDGLCCEYGQGSYALLLDGETIGSNTEFTTGQAQVRFCTTPPTAPPTQAPTFTPTLAPTNAPMIPPTLAPTGVPTIELTEIEETTAPTLEPSFSPIAYCIDQRSFKYNGNRKRKCGYIRKGSTERIIRLCKKKVNRKRERVFTKCRKTCGQVGVGPCKNAFQTSSAPDSDKIQVII